MSGSPKVSVIVPVYNVEMYLEECLDSCVDQTLQDLEIICVNDGSPDGSREILRKRAEGDARIVIIDQENAGLSAARNAGAAAATGEYLYFLDSDDYIDVDALEKLYERASRDRLDVLYFDGEVFFETEDIEGSYPGYSDYYVRKGTYDGVLSGPEMFKRMMEHGDHKPMVPMQFLSAEFYRQVGLSFYEGIVHEDNLFSFECALLAQRAGYESAACFHRRLRAESIMTTGKSLRNFEGFLITYVEMVRFVRKVQTDRATSEAIAQLIAAIHQQAVRVYCELPQEERDRIFELDSRPDALAECRVIRGHAKDRLRADRASRELKSKKKELARVRKSRAFRIARWLRKWLPARTPARG